MAWTAGFAEALTHHRSTGGNWAGVVGHGPLVFRRGGKIGSNLKLRINSQALSTM